MPNVIREPKEIRLILEDREVVVPWAHVPRTAKLHLKAFYLGSYVPGHTRPTGEKDEEGRDMVEFTPVDLEEIHVGT